MFKCLLENRAAIVHLFTVLESQENRLPSDMHWKTVEIVYDTCKPVVEALLLSEAGGKTSLFSTMLSHIIGLYISMCSGPLDSPEDAVESGQSDQLRTLQKEVHTSIQASLKVILKPLSAVEPKTSHFWLVLALDPRFKRLSQLRKLEASDIDFPATELLPQFETQILFPLLKACYIKNNPEEVEALENSEIEDDDDFPQYQATSQVEDHLHSIVVQEYRTFRRIPEIDVTNCPLSWYRLYSSRFPTLASLARHLFSIPPSQCSVERIFSVIGHIASLRRSRLTTQNLENLFLLNSNLRGELSTNRGRDIDSFLETEISLLDTHHNEIHVNDDED